MLTDSEWQQIDDIVRILRIFAEKTSVLQKETMCLSDLFGHWLFIRLALRKHTDIFGRSLLENMIKRESDLLDNAVMASNIYLDGRFHKLLSNMHAISFLKCPHIRSKALKNSASGIEDGHTLDESTTMNELELFLNEIPDDNTEYHAQDSAAPDAVDDIEHKIRSFQPKWDLKTTFVDFWSKQKHLDLFEIARIVSVVQPTQTTVERAFSSLPLILNHLRTNISDENLENTLILRNNKQFYEKLFN